MYSTSHGNMKVYCKELGRDNSSIVVSANDPLAELTTTCAEDPKSRGKHLYPGVLGGPGAPT